VWYGNGGGRQVEFVTVSAYDLGYQNKSCRGLCPYGGGRSLVLRSWRGKSNGGSAAGTWPQAVINGI
jgi:hypothetical protein